MTEGAGGEAAVDRIELSGLRVRGRHGVLAAERELGQVFVVDLVLELDIRDAAASDDVVDTVHYGEVADDVAAVVAGDPVALLERLAQRVAHVVLARERVLAVEVAVHKPQAPIGVAFDDVVVRVRREAPARGADGGDGGPGGTPVVLALGSDLGDRAEVLRSAVASLARVPGLVLTGVSPVVESAPVRLPGTEAAEAPDEDQQPFLNAVVVGRTTLAPLDLLAACHRVEAGHGRVRRERWGPRTLDVDVVDLGGAVARDDERLLLPHPRAHERAFVLVPWSLVAPDAHLAGPGGGAVAELAAALDAAEPGAVVVRRDVDLPLPPPVLGVAAAGGGAP
ncbi:dihydroneopterin aldolase [uncultured Pseudokineococcus sp.]|uniref:dihydroneopterin aldolase n=1 Tax=uncultured Pseudokineococcus sp. TaxID=1642928 RepID=UPI00260C46DB|nr:dihydroneopterin aldolase [uncultured Pseudokineococcus sp.]